MTISSLDPHIIDRCKEFYKGIGDESPSVFSKGWWNTRMMDWCMSNESFKIQLFRFVDVLPYLNSSESLTRHIKEYFKDDDIPAMMKWGAQNSLLENKITGSIVGATIRSNIERMAKQFIIGENIKDSLKNIKKIRKNGFALTIDILGEACVSEKEAIDFLNRYRELLEALKETYPNWKGIGENELDWGHAPRVNISVKPSALYSQTDPVDFEGSVSVIENRLKKIFRVVRNLEGFMCIDMEHYHFKDITLEVYKRIRSCDEFAEYGNLGIAMQSYLKDTDKDIDELLNWAHEKELPISIRLVKGAYWDYENIVAKQNGWDVPVYAQKPETDIAFERHSEKILQNHAICHLACGSHNIRSISAVIETAKKLGVPEEHYEFQLLYGMAEPVRKGLQNIAQRVRLYAPYGDLIPGMAYLVRRLLENTANESFLRQSFVEDTDFERLVENPVETLSRLTAEQVEQNNFTGTTQPEDRFTNEPFADFSNKKVRDQFTDAIKKVRGQLGKTYLLHIDGEDIETEDKIPSINPAKSYETIGKICQADKEHINLAVVKAKKAGEDWATKSFTERAQYLRKAANITRQEQYQLSAWQVLEVGKQWSQAQADVAEAIDFLEYYAREAIKLDTVHKQGDVPGEVNLLSYHPKGIATVIAPWNFPLAISCGMAAAAIVTGNPVLYKPARKASAIGHTLLTIFKKAGLPDGIFNYLPGRGDVIGDYLVEHPDISMIAFTGSKEVGQKILSKAAASQHRQKQIKTVIAELGGKNAIIIDDDADLDEAVKQVIYSAFAFQGQKCSACSRVIVLEAIYDKFKERLIETAKSLAIGPAENPAFYMGPVIDEIAQQNILEAIEIAKDEGELLLLRDIPEKEKGFYVPLTIVEGITPDHRTAQEEIFGPVLAIMKVQNINQAIEWANSTPFGLTGSIFSRSPKHLELARRKINVGNLYLNRGCTGALVDRHPFGGIKMSGIGSKAGGSDYLMQFVEPKLVSENTMRRGFAPTEENNI